MESLRETKQRYYSNEGGGGNNRVADHLIRLQLRCQDVVGTNEILPIVVGSDGRNKLQEQNRNIIAFQDQESNMNCRKNKTSKSHQRQQQLGSISARQSSIQRISQKSSKITSPTSSSITSGFASPLQMQHLNSHHSTISINGHSHTFGSHRSTTTDSSGFSSGASTTSCYSQPQAMHSLNINDCQQQQQRESIPSEHQTTRATLIRSRLIEDLNRLEKIAVAAAEAKAQRNLQTITQPISTDHCQGIAERRVSNNGSNYMSPVATLSRTLGNNCVEIDYSTLCRDEFSSFIDLKNRTIDNNACVDLESRASSLHTSQTLKSKSTRRHKNGVSKQKRQIGGPVLVGVHECESPRGSNYNHSPGSFASSNSSSPVDREKDLNFESTSSSGQNSMSKVDHFDEDNEDRELICHEIFDEDEGLDGVSSNIELDVKISQDAMAHCEVHVEENFSDDNSVDLIDDDQLLVLDRFRSSPCKDLELNLLSRNPGDQYKLSDMLDVYLSRVESLLKLVKGDKSVNLNDLIDGYTSAGQCAASQIDVREEFKTSVDYVQSSNYSKPEVIQEIEVVSEKTYNDDLNEYEDVEDQTNFKTENIITNFGSNFDALLSGPQTTAVLNWWPNQLSAVDTEHDSSSNANRSDENNNKPTNVFIDQKQCRMLEKSFLNRWLELCSLDADVEISATHCESLVKTISWHMNEFVANYNAYQKSMCHETSFALDWHENWLFATSMPLKRAYQLSELHHQEPSSSLKVSTPGDNSILANIDQQQQQQQQQQLFPKRAKLMQPSSVEVNELLNYSTLLINKYKPVKVTFVEGPDPNESRPREIEQQINRYRQRIDAYYEQQPDYLNELQQTFLELSGQVNVCHLLLNDSFTELECDTKDKAELDFKRPKRSLEIEYESSLNSGRSLVNGQLLCFRAHGYLFELRKLRYFEMLTTNKRHKQKLEAFKRLILNRLRSSCHWVGSQSSLNVESKFFHVSEELPQKQCQQDQVRFLVQLSNVQVSQPLHVIQFCAKVTGALPIRVGWYRLLDDGSQCELTANKKSVAQYDKTMMVDEWPMTMWAKHEFEYENDWLSWYRFKRDQGDILFEIRNAHLEQDYGHTFKCVIENYCSIKECEFTLELKRREPVMKLIKLSSDANRASCLSRIERMKTRRNRREAAMDQTEDELGRIRLHKVELTNENQEAGQAILRTWSQRTLNKRAPLVDHNDTGSSEQHAVTAASVAATSDLSQPGLHESCQQLQTVGRLSAQAMNDCKFGTNYPYHPVSLMRRLEENKMSLTLRSRLRLAGKPTSDGHKNMIATDNLTAGATSVEDVENEVNKATKRGCWMHELDQQHHNRQVNQESELGSSELFSSPLACPLATPPTNRLEVRDCGELRGAGRQCATFMRPSHRQPTSNTISDEGQLLFGKGGDQDGNHYHIVGEDQQKSNENCDRGRANHGQPGDEHAPKPKPRPRQKPTAAISLDQGDDRLTGHEAGPRRQPLSDAGNLKGVHHAPGGMRSSELQSSLSAAQPVEDGDRLNYDNYHADYDYQKSRASNNWMPAERTSPQFGRKQTQSASLAIGDDLQTSRTFQPPQASTSSESRTNQTTQLHDDNTKPSLLTGSSGRSSNGSSQAALQPAVAELELAKPKSVRSLISRFNMI